MTKQELRKEMKQKLKGLSKEQFAVEGQKAAARLIKTELWQSYKRILIYLSMPDELDTTALLNAAFNEGKEVYSPKVESDTSMRFFRVSADESSWVTGAFDIREPAGRESDVFDPNDGKALVISPGLAFDRSGNRMGRGKGYYDRFYEKLFSASPDSACCALCMSISIVPSVPTDMYDRKVNAICTQDEFIKL
ncbi:MAG: 5-formyltetrahydrofolate cyclo-ligase [Termitinemataceae bacterium]|nr:MAG: 5-formyltetrahydrofolate cyclo-ligase [Termitinemataceae bacterium]